MGKTWMKLRGEASDRGSHHGCWRELSTSRTGIGWRSIRVGRAIVLGVRQLRRHRGMRRRDAVLASQHLLLMPISRHLCLLVPLKLVQPLLMVYCLLLLLLILCCLLLLPHLLLFQLLLLLCCLLLLLPHLRGDAFQALLCPGIAHVRTQGRGSRH